MKFTLSWLKDHLETEASLDAVSRALTMIGLEIEEVVNPGAMLEGFVVGHVVHAGKHPDADKLRLCRVSVGDREIQIVCGAPNARAGIKVALALPGCVIPLTGEPLKKGKIRGIESQGMMCSSRELKLGDDHEGIIELPDDALVGAPLADVLRFDPVIDIAVTPNRPDCLGVRGVARDLSAFGLGALKAESWDVPVAGCFKSPIALRHEASSEAQKACPVFYGRLIRGVQNGESPHWLKDRLLKIGLRPVSALVDITNYITIGWCRPLHVFDADTLSGDIHIRMAQEGETLAALNEKTYILDRSVVAIADDKGVQSLGGVIGGMATGTTEKTVNVFIESAWFDPHHIAATGRKFAIESDARHRFERGVDPASVSWGLELATRLILDLCGGEPSEVVVAGSIPSASGCVSLRPGRVKHLIGVEISPEKQKSILERLGCDVREQEDLLWVTPPTWRPDLQEEVDLVEEVMRINGLDKVPEVPLSRPSFSRPLLTSRQRQVRSVIRALATRGLFEAVTWSFLPREQAALFGGGGDDLVLSNPISVDLNCMRPSLLPNLIKAVGRNAARGMPDVALFEVGTVFNGGEPGEQEKVAGGVRAGGISSRHWNIRRRLVDVFDAKADALGALKAVGCPTETLQTVPDAPTWYHPGRSGSLKLGPKKIAFFGEIHPSLLKTLDVKGPVVGFEVFLDAVPVPKEKTSRAKSFLTLSPFQPLERDFAFIVDCSVRVDQIVRAAKSADKALVADVMVFDVYEGEGMSGGKKSVAVCVTLQPMEKTLTDEEIEMSSTKIIAAIEKATGGVLRG